MTGTFDYREMARDCMRQAETTNDPAVKKTLLGVAKLYNQTALAMEAARAAPLKTADLQ